MPPKDDFIGVEFDPGINQFMHRISSLPKVYQDEILDEMDDYGLEVLRKYPKRKYVTRKQAYGKTWFNKHGDNRQRKWFMWAVSTDQIPGWRMTKDGPVGQYKRSGKLGEAWKSSRQGDEVHYTNQAPGAVWVMGEKQSRHEEMVGWKKASAIMAGALTFRSSKFRTAVQKAYQRAIRKLKLG